MTLCGRPTRLINYEELLNLKDNPSIYIIDVRQKKEICATGSLPSSINIPLDDLYDALNMSRVLFQKNYNRIKPLPNSTIIFSCASGHRSERAMRMAIKMGYTDAYNYAGGWNDYEAHLRAEPKDSKSCECPH